jgi:hypothetical protein
MDGLSTFIQCLQTTSLSQSSPSLHQQTRKRRFERKTESTLVITVLDTFGLLKRYQLDRQQDLWVYQEKWASRMNRKTWGMEDSRRPTRRVQVWVGGRQEGVPPLGRRGLQSLRGHTIHSGLRHRHTIHSALRHAVPSCPLLLLLLHLPSVLPQHIRHRSVPIVSRIGQGSPALRKDKRLASSSC